jgi:hypothetical protein
MHLRLTDFGILTMALVAVTVWMAAVRSKLPNESNWPLVYWSLMVAYLRWSEDIMNPYVIYLGLIIALFVRFEFLASGLIRILSVLEWICWGYVIIAGLMYSLS